MQYVYAALLLHRLGKQVNEEGINKIVEATGTSVDEASVKTLVASLKGVDIEKAIEEAKSEATVSASAPAAKAEEKKEEKKEEKAAEMAAEGLASLFG